MSNQAETNTTQQRWISNRHIDNKWLAKLSNAEERGIPCNFSVTEFKHMWKISQPVCDLSGEALVADGNLPNSATLDRIDSKSPLGYHPSNCCIVSHRINQLKNILTEDTKVRDIKVTKEDRVYISAMFKSLNDKEYMDKLKEKYVMIKKNDNVVEDASVGILLETSSDNPSQASVEEVQEVFSTSADVCIAKDYYTLGELVGTVSSFNLTFNQYKNLMQRKSCMLTDTKFKQEDKKVLYWKTKTLPFSKDNVCVTSEKLQINLDKFTAGMGYGFTELQNMCKIVATLN